MGILATYSYYPAPSVSSFRSPPFILCLPLSMIAVCVVYDDYMACLLGY